MKYLEIAQKIKNHGGRAFLVGGYVRDALMGKESKDIDIEVYNLDMEKVIEILKQFGNPELVGQSFGVIKLGNMDISLPRAEKKAGIGHRGFEVTVDKDMSFKEACRRRDLTINAILKDPLTNEIIDLFGGVQDIENKIIRCTDSRTFAEDPLRVLRVAQFAARFEFTVDKETTKLCKSLVPEMKSLPSERIFEEVRKILLKCSKPSIAFQWLRQIGALKTIGINKLHCVTYVELDRVPLQSRVMDIMLAVLYKMIKTRGVVAHMLYTITNETTLIKSVLNLWDNRNEIKNIECNEVEVRKLALRTNVPKLLLIEEFSLHSPVYFKNKTQKIQDIQGIYEEIKDKLSPLVTGDDLIRLGLKPSKEFGEIHKELFQRQIEGEFNSKELGIELARTIWERK